MNLLLEIFMVAVAENSKKGVNMNQKRKILLIIINLILILFLISNTVFGTLIDVFEDSIDITGADDLKDTGGTILGIIRVIGTIVSVAMIMILGIKYMVGSAEEKAGYKKTMFPYLIGAILIFASTSLADMIYEWAQNI